MSGAEYDFDLEACHRELRRLEWEFDEGLFADQILDYIKPKTISGTTLAGVVEIVNGYTFVFPIAAEAVNLRGANTNISELSVTPANGVSIRPNNSAGNSITYTPATVPASDIAEAVWNEEL